MIPKIIQFLGYMPYDSAKMTLGARIVAIRHGLGVSQKELARQLPVDRTTLRLWELGRSQPLEGHMEMLEALLIGYVSACRLA